MPNPFVRLGTPNRSTQPPDRPKPIAPVPESFAEPVFAYRGTENHGVAGGAHWTDPGAHTADPTIDAVFEVETEAPHVVPVRIVHDEVDSRQRVVLQTRQLPLTVGSPPQLVLARNDRRSKAGLKFQTGGAGQRAYVGGTPDQAIDNQGYPIELPNGGSMQEWTTTVQGEVYGYLPFITGGSPVGTVLNVFAYEEIAQDL